MQSEALQWWKEKALEITLFVSGKEGKKKITHTENVKQEHTVLIVKLLSGQALYQELQWSEHDSLSECRKRLF